MTLQQLTLPFGHQFAEDRASLVRAIRAAGLRAAEETWLLYVHDVSGDKELRRTYNEIAARLNCSRRTAIRLVQRCIDVGILRVVDDKYRSGGQRENSYSIDWDGTRRWAFASDATPQHVQRGVTPQCQSVTGECQSVTPQCQSVTPYKEIDPLLDPPKDPPPPEKPDGGGGFVARGEWERIRRRLRSHGLSDTPGAVRAAQDDGLTPAAVDELIDQWEAARPAWDVGGLYWRITRGTWPEQSEAYLRAQRDAKLADERRRQRIEQARRQQQADQEAASARELEARAGPALDALSEDRYERLLERVYPTDFERCYARRNRASPLVRHALLQAIAEEQEVMACE